MKTRASTTAGFAIANCRSEAGTPTPPTPSSRSTDLVPRFWSPKVVFAVGVSAVLGACGYDRTDRWVKGKEPPPPACELDQRRCSGSQLQRCISAIGGPVFELEEDCGAQG